MLNMVDGLLKEQFPAHIAGNPDYNFIEELSSIEISALRNVAGYMIRSAMNLVKSRHHAEEKTMVFLRCVLRMMSKTAVQDGGDCL